jgi:hypothetical protein
MQPFDQTVQVGLQIYSVHFLGHFVDASSRILSQPLKASPQQFLVHQMIQTCELKSRLFAGLLCYAVQFRCHWFPASVNGQCFLMPRSYV